VISPDIVGSPGPSSPQPDYTLLGNHPHHRYAGTDDGRGTDQALDAKRLTLMSGCRWASDCLAYLLVRSWLISNTAPPTAQGWVPAATSM
jgi:hypothetical protein